MLFRSAIFGITKLWGPAGANPSRLMMGSSFITAWIVANCMNADANNRIVWWPSLRVSTGSPFNRHAPPFGTTNGRFSQSAI